MVVVGRVAAAAAIATTTVDHLEVIGLQNIIGTNNVVIVVVVVAEAALVVVEVDELAPLFVGLVDWAVGLARARERRAVVVDGLVGYAGVCGARGGELVVG